jgi:preprotein translocase subunit SecD
MMIGAGRFNTYLFLLAVMLSAGCKTAEERTHDKTLTTFHLHLEANQGFGESTAVIEIAGAQISVNNAPFLDETSITNAVVVDTRDGGFAMRIQFDRHGALVLDNVTTENRGRHMAIFTQFGPGKLEHQRWLGAPYIGTSLAGGILLFTPNSTREEAEQVALGLNNAAHKRRKESWIPPE